MKKGSSLAVKEQAKRRTVDSSMNKSMCLEQESKTALRRRLYR